MPSLRKITTRAILFIIALALITPIITLSNVSTVEAADAWTQDIKQVNNHTIKASQVSEIINVFKAKKILPSVVISQMWLETQWGTSNTSGKADNNWSGIKYPGSGKHGATEGTPATDNSGGNYAHYKDLHTFFEDKAELLGGSDTNYAIAGQSDAKKAVAGLFKVGGAKANYATADANGYIQNVITTRDYLNKTNDNALDKMDAIAVKDGKWDTSSLTSGEVKDIKETAGTPNKDADPIVDNTFTVNGYGTVNGKDWQDVEIASPTQEQISTDIQGKQKDALNDWIDDYNNANTMSAIGVVRTAIQTLAICLVVFSIFLVLAFSFDRVGVTDVSAVALLTNGKLETVYESKDSTFLDKRQHGASTKFVTTKDIAIIVVLTLILAILMFSGKIYVICITLYRGADFIVHFANDKLAGLN